MIGMSSAWTCDSLVCSTWPVLVHVMTKEGQLEKQVDLGFRSYIGQCPSDLWQHF